MSQTTEPKRKELRILEVANGGYLVEERGAEQHLRPEVLGAYSDYSDLIDAMPDLLGICPFERGLVEEMNSRDHGELTEAERASFEKLMERIGKGSQ